MGEVSLPSKPWFFSVTDFVIDSLYCICWNSRSKCWDTFTWFDWCWSNTGISLATWPNLSRPTPLDSLCLYPHRLNWSVNYGTSTTLSKRLKSSWWNTLFSPSWKWFYYESCSNASLTAYINISEGKPRFEKSIPPPPPLFSRPHLNEMSAKNNVCFGKPSKEK